MADSMSMSAPRMRMVFAAVVMLVQAGASPAAAATISLIPDDTFINLDDVSAYSATTLNLYTWPANQVANAIILKLDLSTVPSDATINEATLHIFLVEADGTSDTDYTITIHRVINHDPTVSLATGVTYDGTNGWTANPCCNNDIPLAQADISSAYATVSMDKALGEKELDVTTLVQEWHNGTHDNYGLLLNSDPTRDRDRYRYFASSREADAGLHPVVEITYATTNDGAPVGGDPQSTTARGQGCSPEEYYDLLASECRKPETRGCSSQHHDAVSILAFLFWTVVWRRHRREGLTSR